MRISHERGPASSRTITLGSDVTTAARSCVAPLAWLAPLLLALALAALPGCSDDTECLTCPSPGPPASPSGVFKINGDGLATVYWYDIYYPTIDQLVAYRIYKRDYEFGDADNPDRVFDYLAEVAWDENYDADTNQHWYEDHAVENGHLYEYAVSAVNAAGSESALSYELVIATPLPGDDTTLFDVDGPNVDLSGFDFSLAVSGPGSGRVDPTLMGTTADVLVRFVGGVPFLEAVRPTVSIQDFGTFLSDDGATFYFDSVSWAPAAGYSTTGILELIEGHVYIVEIYDDPDNDWHYAKLGVTASGSGSVQVLWAYQLIHAWPQLDVPVLGKGDEPERELIEL